jgi:hypothetical protein
MPEAPSSDRIGTLLTAPKLKLEASPEEPLAAEEALVLLLLKSLSATICVCWAKPVPQTMNKAKARPGLQN